ncbi:glycosyltransferase family 2 protein, partial [Enterococcus sp. 3H8_DIV0648]|uniref:glycosyltransferase family 2 protein n=2 Tax=Enterococcus TaxID=1350 RepID=UPI000B676AD7
MKIKISVVIPFYNVEIFAERCIKSVIKQTYKDIEIILVDDGSTDATGYILDKYRNIDSRIKVHHKVNGGLSDARNFGVKQSNGNYITFIDGDDYVSKYYIESLVDGINLGGDISCSQFHIVYEDSKLVEAESKKKGIQIVDEVTAIKCILNRKFQHNAWGKLFPRKYFNDLEFPKGIYYEDMAVIYEILSCAKKVALIKSKDYYYVQR